jgi:hypothetical protein
MIHVNATRIYKDIKNKNTAYEEEKHCPMIIKVMSELGTVSGFCVTAEIADSTFYEWTKKYPVFNECYRVGCMLARENWEEEGRLGKGNESFNLEYWRTVGASRFGIGKNNRIRIELNEESSPYEQYQQLIRQASYGDFNSAEIKQLMESINVGVRVYETFKLQQEVDNMKDDLFKMNQHSGNNIISIKEASKIN